MKLPRCFAVAAAALALALCAVPLRAAAQALSWEACVAETAQGNAALEAARRRFRASDSLARAARGGYYPELDANLSYRYGDDRGAGASGNASTYDASLDGRQNVFGGFSDKAEIARAEASREVAAAALEVVRAEVSYTLKTAFEQLLFAQANKRLTEEITRRRQENYRLVSLRYESGGENRGSVLLFEAHLEQARYEDLQAKNAVAVAGARLKEVLGRDEPGLLIAQGDVPITEPPAAPDFEALAKQTPQFRRALAEERAVQQGITLAASPFYPSLDVSGSVSREGGDSAADENHWSVGADLNVPLFDGMKDYHSLQSAKAEAEASSVDALAVVREARSELERTWAAFVEAKEKLRIDERFLEAATIRAEIARKKYNNGLLSFEDWDVIENELIVRQKNALQSRRDLVTSEAAWERAQGKAVLP